MNALIVGAGLCGLALARRMQQQNINFDIIEKANSFSTVGAAICLPANAVLGVEQLGLKEELLEIAHRVTSIEYAKADGPTLAKASLLEFPLSKAPFVALRRNKLHEILHRGFEDKVEFNTTISALTNRPDGVEVCINNGETRTYDLVVAADGIHSETRRLVWENSETQSLAVSNWRFIAKTQNSSQEPVYYVGDDHAFMIYPISKNEVYCYGQIADPECKWRDVNSVEALKEIFKQYCSPVQTILEQLSSSEFDDSSIVRGTLESVRVESAYKSRVALVGDALHGCPPSLQQGVGLGLEDIHLLADELSQKSIDDALIQFNQRRLPRVKWVVEESNKIIRLAAKGKSFFGRMIRNAMIRKKGPANVVGWRKLLEETY